MKAGAVGWRLFKPTGMDTPKPDGTRLQMADPDSRRSGWAGRLNIRCSFTRPSRPSSSSPSTCTTSAGSSWPCSRAGGGYLSRAFETLMTERDNLFKRHPKTSSSRRTLVARQRPPPGGPSCSTRSECRPRSRGGALRAWASAGAATTSSWRIRTGSCSARTLFGRRNIRPIGACWRAGRLFRLLSRLSRILENVWDGPARCGVEKLYHENARRIAPGLLNR